MSLIHLSFLSHPGSKTHLASFQMLLPVGFDRENLKDYEEVNIPPSDPPPVHIGKNLVSISELDEVSDADAMR